MTNSVELQYMCQEPYEGLATKHSTLIAQGRLSTAPTGDMNSLNDLMKISQKKLQVRSDKLAAQYVD